MATYYYLRTTGAEPRSIGGPYTTVAKLAKGVARAEARGESRNRMDAKRLVSGRWADLTAAEASALVALMDG
jgi:hypothetical protein